MGLCVPDECNTTSLAFFDKLYQQGIKYTHYMSDPNKPEYSFPSEYQQSLSNQSLGFWFLFILMIGFIGLSIFGIFIQRGNIGNKPTQSSMVEAIEEGKPDKTSIEAKKTKWALIIYSFSLVRNFQEIFVKPNKTIKDKKFEIFNGLKFLMAIWIMLGNVYLLGSQYGNTGP